MLIQSLWLQTTLTNLEVISKRNNVTNEKD